MKDHPNKLLSSRTFTYFLQLTDTLNYTKAAQLLGISQPALTQQIKKMEASVGTPLFENHGKQLQMTEAGKIMKRTIDSVYEILIEGTESIQQESSVTSGKITIGVSASVQDKVLTDFIIDYYRMYPNIEISLMMVGRKEVWDFLDKNKIDIAILYLPDGMLKKWKSYEATSIIKDEVLFIHNNPEFYGKTSITYGESMELPWATYPKTYFVSEVIQSAFHSQEFRLPEAVVHFTRPDQMLRFARATGVYTVVPKSFFEPYRHKENLHALPFEPPIKMNLSFIYRKEKLKIPRVKHFFETFFTYIEDEDYLSRLNKFTD